MVRQAMEVGKIDHRLLAHARSADASLPEAHFAGIGAWEYDLIRDRLTWTGGVYDIFDLPQGVAIDRRAVVEMYHDDSRTRMEALRAHLLRHGGAFTLEAKIWTARGSLRWMRLNAGVAVENGRPIRLFGSKQDISHEREAIARLRERADYDALTALPNRGSFESQWHALRQGRAEDVKALGLVDLDHFKAINDNWGHDAGDECLRVTADRLRRCFAGLAFLARFGGDEFALLWRGRTDRTFLDWRFRLAELALSQPISWDGHLIPISVSIGLAVRSAETEPRDLFRRADQALYRAKAVGRSATVIEGDLTPA